MTVFSQLGGPVQSMTETAGGNSSAFECVSGDHTSPTVQLRLRGTANAAAANVATVTNASLNQATTFTIPDPGAASATFDLALSSSSATAPGLFSRVITATAAALATAGKVTVQAKTSATSQFGVYSMRVIKSTGLSGGGGDRLLALTDGTKVFNGTGITAALLGTPITTRPAGTGNPDCGTAVDPTASTANADIYLQYTGGTTDFTTGSVIVEVILYQVTA